MGVSPRGFRVVIFGLILGAAFFLRAWGISYGLPCTWIRPDEDRLISTSLRLGFPDLDPGYYLWPGLPFLAARPILEAVNCFGPEAASTLAGYGLDPAPFHLSLRWLSCWLGVATVAALAILGSRLFCRTTGLAAAAFYAVAFLPVREAHFALLDVPLAFLLVLGFLSLASLSRQGRIKDYVRAGLFLGLAVSVKYYGVFFLFPLAVAHFSRPVRRWGPLALALLLAAAIFLAANPWLFSRVAGFWEQVREGILASQYLRGFELVPRAAATRGWIHHPTFSLRYGLGLPLEILALAALFFSLACLRRSVSWRLLASFVFPFGLALAAQRSCFLRYTMPLLPFLVLAAAEFLRRVTLLLPRGRFFLPLLVGALALEPAVRSLRFDALIAGEPDSRLAAGEWLARARPRALLFPREMIFSRPAGYLSYPRAWSSGLPSAREIRTALEASGAWLIVDEHPLEYAAYAPGEARELTAGLSLVRRFPGSVAPGAVFDPFDAFFVPVDGFGSVSRPGPDLAVYRLERSPLPPDGAVP